MLKYLTAFLFVLALIFGGVAYHQSTVIDTKSGELSRALEDLRQSRETTLNVAASCAITDAKVAELQKKLDAQDKGLRNDLESLETINLTETRVDAKAPKQNADNDRLSPDLMRLLDGAYCSGASSDPYCTP
jgi:hypothetical protein